MRSAGICFNHQHALHHSRDGGRNCFRMTGWSPLRPATGPPVRSWPASRAGPGRDLCCASSSSKGNSYAAADTAAPAAGASRCSTALADEQLLPSLLKLSHCRFSTMFGPDELAAPVPRALGDAEVLPNTIGLPVAGEGKHSEHIVDQVENALPK